MSDLNIIIGKNLMTLRKKKGLTQLQLAEQFNYSDKSISKWEKGEAMPAIDILKNLADFYGVTLDFLTKEEHEEITQPEVREKKQVINRYAIALLAIVSVWVFATICFSQFKIILGTVEWRFFVWAVPISFILAIIFNSIWGKAKMTYVYISLFIWTTLASLYLEFLSYNMWEIFLIGVPIQLAIYLTSRIKKPRKKRLKQENQN